MVDVKALAEAAREMGWARTSGSLDDLRRAASRRGWVEASIRKGEPAVGTLKPTSQREAAPRSLSALVGFGEQPLHTDGAHLFRPPDIVVLYSLAPNATPTLVWHAKDLLDSGIRDSLDHGVFRVRSGRTTFLTTVRQPWGLRFDPGCMQAMDGRARRVVAAIRNAAPIAVPLQWQEENSMVVIDNTFTLHARGRVSLEDSSRTLQRVAYLTGEVM